MNFDALFLASAVLEAATAVAHPRAVAVSAEERQSASAWCGEEAMSPSVRRVAAAMSRLNAIDRLWLNHIYSNAASVVAADGNSEQAVVVTTEGLKAVHTAILRFVWRGMSESTPIEYEELREAIEGLFRGTVGDESKKVTPELRLLAVKMFDSIAWAGLGKDG